MKRGTLLELENVNIYAKCSTTGVFIFSKKIRKNCFCLLLENVKENTVFVKIFISGSISYIDWWRTSKKHEIQRIHELKK